MLTDDCLEYLAEVAPLDVRFEHYAQVLAALEATKLEFYRRAVAPYEDAKIKENGDVY